MKRLLRKAWIGGLGMLILIAWASVSAAAAQPPSTGTITKAVAVLHPTVGHKAYGVVIFDQERQGMLVVADIGGLSPGRHTLQIHEYGDCSALDATTTGKVFKLKQKAQGHPALKHPPAGELGQIEADSSGHARFETIDPLLSLGGADTIIGHSVVVSSGAAGPRTACGVIGIVAK